MPYHLTTLEFNEQIKGLLNDRGIYMVNVVDKLHSGRFLRAFVNTMERTFPYVYVMRDDDNWESDQQYTYVVAGSIKPISLPDMYSANLTAGRGATVARIMPDDTFDVWINDQKNILLTDDYVPVDNLLAPLYLESR